MTVTEFADGFCEIMYRSLEKFTPQQRYDFWIRVEGNACSAQGDARNEMVEAEEKKGVNKQ